MRKLLAGSFILLFFPLLALAQNIPAIVTKNITTPNLIGKSDLKFFGLKVYHIALWSENQSFSYDKKFAIHILYNTSFSKKSLAERSVEEIKKLHSINQEQENSYLKKFEEIFTSVKKDDEKIALFTPGQGVTVFFNGQVCGKISDLELARFFVDIWLDERGSYPEITKKIRGKNN